MSSDHERNVIVVCQGLDDKEDILVYGPFQDEKWAQAWIKQHNHSPVMDSDGTWVSEDEQDRRIEDEDHYCNFPGADHYIWRMWIPGFDPTTLPVYG